MNGRGNTGPSLVCPKCGQIHDEQAGGNCPVEEKEELLKKLDEARRLAEERLKSNETLREKLESNAALITRMGQRIDDQVDNIEMLQDELRAAQRKINAATSPAVHGGE